MESFEGVFVASTNLMSGLDQATLRRFDLKLRFDYLSSQQAWDLLQRQCTALGVAAPDEEARRRLSGLRVLTPGDYAAVARQHRFTPLPDARALVAALAAECALKEGGRAAGIGFV
jgi:hypothetical protein